MTLPVIIAASSIPEAPPAQDLLLIPAATLLKPYSTEELLKAVHEVLLTTFATPGQKLAGTARLSDNPSDVGLRMQ